MYRIKYMPDKKLYEIHSKFDGAFSGDLTSITKKAIEIGISQNELTTAYIVMSKNKDLVAEFGINRIFMYSHKKIS